MLTAPGCTRRRERLWKALPGPCDAVVIGRPAYLTYFAGYSASPFAFRTTESAALLVLEPGRATLVADDMLGPYTEKAEVDAVVGPTWYDGRHSAPDRGVQLVETTLGVLAKVEGDRIGVELAGVPAGVVEGVRAARPGLTIVDIGPILRPLRRAKDEDEVAAIGRAIRAGEAGHAAALREMKPGMSEVDAYRVVLGAAIEALGEPAIVYGDFVAGPRTETERGGPPTSRAIEPGDLLLLDFSVVVDGYRGDFTNTFAVGGGPTDRQRALFDACVGALAAGEAALRPGTPARAVDEAVRGHFAGLGLDHAFLSHSGHGIGLGHPEPPYLVPEASETLMAGDLIAIEPGLYIEGEGGMRYERNYLITDDGYQCLSNHRIQIDQAR